MLMLNDSCRVVAVLCFIIVEKKLNKSKNKNNTDTKPNKIKQQQRQQQQSKSNKHTKKHKETQRNKKHVLFECLRVCHFVFVFVLFCFSLPK